MVNKKASLSTLVFVMMVFLVCITCLVYFAKYKNTISSEFVSLEPINNISLMIDQISLTIKIFGEQSAFYAYHELIKNFSTKEVINGEEYILFNKTKFSQKDYLSIFNEKFNYKLNLMLEDYPEETINEKIILDSLKSTSVNFDGENIFLFSKIVVKGYGSEKLKLDYEGGLTYTFSLSDVGLVNLSKVNNIEDLCPVTLKSRITCVPEVLYGFNFFPEGYRLLEIGDSEKDKFYLVKLISEKSYFDGSADPENFKISFLLPLGEAYTPSR